MCSFPPVRAHFLMLSQWELKFGPVFINQTRRRLLRQYVALRFNGQRKIVVVQ